MKLDTNDLFQPYKKIDFESTSEISLQEIHNGVLLVKGGGNILYKNNYILDEKYELLGPSFRLINSIKYFDSEYIIIANNSNTFCLNNHNDQVVIETDSYISSSSTFYRFNDKFIINTGYDTLLII